MGIGSSLRHPLAYLRQRFGRTRAAGRRPFLRLAYRPHLPRRTVRLRLTLIYGLLFLASGAGLLFITNLLVRQTADPHQFKVYVVETAHGSTVGINPLPNKLALPFAETHGVIQETHHLGPGGSSGQSSTGHSSGVSGLAGPGDHPLTAQQAQDVANRLQPQLTFLRNDELNHLLLFSAVALGFMALLSMGLGWIAAGRALRPLRAITSAARDISATNLNARLALDGPDDELKDLARTFNDLLARLEASFEAQRRFVANASHELRTPLARQRTLAQVAITDPDATAESLRHAHERVLASGAQQERLIEALLTLARSEAGLQRHEAVELSEVATRVLNSPPPELDRLGLDVDRRLMPVRVPGDPRLLERLVANLFDNAVRHNVAGGRVEVATGWRDGEASLSVTNTGPVVPPSEVERLFQPFQRLELERTSHGDGVGLGLSIVQAIADAHGATVHARARAGGGLAVEVRFRSTSSSFRSPDAPPA